MSWWFILEFIIFIQLWWVGSEAIERLVETGEWEMKYLLCIEAALILFCYALSGLFVTFVSISLGLGT